MRKGSISERIDIRSYSLDFNSPSTGTFLNEFRFMNTLGTRQNLLATNEDIVTVREFWVVWVGHGVERTNIQGVLVHNKEVGIILLPHNVTQLLLVFSTQVIVITLVDSGLPQQLASGGIINLERLLKVLQILKSMLLLHSLNFLSALFRKSVKNVNKQISQHIQHLIVMLNDGHFQIQSSKLTQVPTCVGIFSTEDRANFEDALESTTCRSHLLV
mmetsp:Transcript_3391/g.5223  ORF Transcript_3391/g.5223 Transcript_3391/m.5223 type:complete len:216 (+) Transcript_3391:282-929(+)